MKSSIVTTALLVIMTSYFCDACYFTNCPNRWNWSGKRSDYDVIGDNDVIGEGLMKRAEANPLLRGYLEKVNVSFVKLY